MKVCSTKFMFLFVDQKPRWPMYQVWHGTLMGKYFNLVRKDIDVNEEERLSKQEKW